VELKALELEAAALAATSRTPNRNKSSIQVNHFSLMFSKPQETGDIGGPNDDQDKTKLAKNMQILQNIGKPTRPVAEDLTKEMLNDMVTY
jgi:hypothetical protein